MGKWSVYVKLRVVLIWEHLLQPSVRGCKNKENVGDFYLMA